MIATVMAVTLTAGLAWWGMCALINRGFLFQDRDHSDPNIFIIAIGYFFVLLLVQAVVFYLMSLIGREWGVKLLVDGLPGAAVSYLWFRTGLKFKQILPGFVVNYVIWCICLLGAGFHGLSFSVIMPIQYAGGAFVLLTCMFVLFSALQLGFSKIWSWKGQSEVAEAKQPDQADS